MPKVYIPNKSGQDFSSAEDFGEIIFLTEGLIADRYGTNHLYMQFVDKMQDAEEEDYLAVSSLPILTAIATGVLVEKFGRINFLLFKDGKYIERNINFNNLV